MTCFGAINLKPSDAASMLGHFVHQLSPNSSLPAPASVFSCSYQPPITLQDYCSRLASHMGCQAEVFVTAGVLVDRLHQKRPDLFHQLAEMKIMLAAIVLAVKFVQDACYPNSYFAFCGGVSLIELNHMESVLLSELQYRAFVSQEQFECALNLFSTFQKIGGVSVVPPPPNPFSAWTQPITSCSAHSSPTNSMSSSPSDAVVWGTAIAVCESILDE